MTQPLNIPLQSRWPHPQDWYLCHRGADRAVIDEIVAVLATQFQAVTVQPEDGLAWSWPDFRASIRRAIAGGETRFIMILNRHFPGAAFRQTMGPIFKECDPWQAMWRFATVRIEPCDMGDIEGTRADLAGLTDPAARIAQILLIAPSAGEECL